MATQSTVASSSPPFPPPSPSSPRLPPSSSVPPVPMIPASSFLRGKVALVTGGSGTIGKAISEALLSEGATVILTARGADRLEEARRALLEGLAATASSSPMSPAHRPAVHAILSDVSKEASVVELFRNIDGLGCGLDLLVNNAGINVAGGAEDLTASDVEAVLGVNVVGAFLCAREALVRFRGAKGDGNGDGGGGKGGRIINVGSLSARSPRPDALAYTTSKFALRGLTQSLALEGRTCNVAVGVVHPGNVVTDLLTPEDVEARGRTEGFLAASDVARCVAAMASLPYSANVLEMTVLPTTQPYVGRG